MRSKITVSAKAVAFAIKGNLPDDVKLERLRQFLEQEAKRNRVGFDPDGPVLQGKVDGKDELFFYNGPKGKPLALPVIEPTD